MFNVGDRVRVKSDDFGSNDLVGKVGTVHLIDETQESCDVVVVLENFEPMVIDLFMAEILGYPKNSMPFETHELELI